MAGSYSRGDSLHKHMQYWAFHEPCSTCSSAASAAVHVCGFCKHMRLFHMLVCENVLAMHTEIELGTWKDIRTRRDQTGCVFCGLVDTIVVNFTHVAVPRGTDMTDARISLDWMESKTDVPSSMFSILLIIKSNAGTHRHHFSLDNALIVHSPQARTDEISGGAMGPHISWQRLRSMLQQCESGHDGCRLDASPAALPPGFCVIDVEQRCLVRVDSSNSDDDDDDDCRFVALSYVWGQQPDPTKLFSAKGNGAALMRPGSLCASRLPEAIEDAIQACTRLGERFLWVDRLCIVQDDDAIRDANIQAMAGIYTRAVLVLLMTASANADTSSPGVRQPRPWPLGHTQRITMGPLTLTSRLPTIQYLLRHSPWSSRGWTYQEAVLARRRLFLTPLQAVFDCKEGAVYEDSGRCGVVRDYHGTAYELPLAYRLDPQSSLFGSYSRHVESYTQRALTFDMDIHRAFAGVCVALYGDHPQAVLCSLPARDFDCALFWQTPQRQATPRVPRSDSNNSNNNNSNNNNNNSSSSKAAILFPSWSWSHVHGPALYKHENKWCGALVAWARVMEEEEEGGGGSGPLVPLITHASPTARMHENWQVALAVAAAEGCLEKAGADLGTRPHFWDIGAAEDLQDACRRRWPTYSDYWERALGSLPPLQLADLPGQMASHMRPGVLAARAQIARLRLQSHATDAPNLFHGDTKIASASIDALSREFSFDIPLDAMAISIYGTGSYSHSDAYSTPIGEDLLSGAEVWVSLPRQAKVVCLQ